LARRVRKKKLGENRKHKPEIDLTALRHEQDQVAQANISLLSSWRQDADITQAEMGEVLGVSEDVVYKIEALKRPLSLEGSIAWARRTGKDFHEYTEELCWKLRKLYPARKP